MAWIRCQQCQATVSDVNGSCPKCGSPLPSARVQAEIRPSQRVSTGEAPDSRGTSFSVHPYRADGGSDSGSVLVLVLALSGTGVILGLVASFISQALYLYRHSWKTREVLGFIGGDPKTTGAALQGGRMGELIACGPTRQGGPGSLVVSVASCQKCGASATIDVKLERLIVRNRQRKLKLVTHVTYPGGAREAFARLYATQ